MMPFLSKFFDEIIVANETHRHNHAQLIIRGAVIRYNVIEYMVIRYMFFS